MIAAIIRWSIVNRFLVLLATLIVSAWGVYSLRGRTESRQADPTRVTAGNFARALPFAVALLAAAASSLHVDLAGAALAMASGALTSGVGYAIWYAALPQLRAASAATLQLSVPVLTALAGVLLLAEPPGARLVIASAAVLGGIALVIVARR